ncbi:MAG: hypothetical protein IAE87_06380 [Rhodobacteraceae bacterium]|jgi:hypothetical protein|nr:hypothetical protein [Paracoccaceae bacterium]
MTEEIEIRAGGIRIGFEPDCGYLTGLAVTDEGVTVAPLHVAPWAGEAMPDTAAPHQARLRGDYFCAPMGRGADGLHGLTANGRWQVMPTAPGTLRAVLQGAVQGATVVKEAQLQDGQPFLYQRHLFIGGSGALPMCSHAMVAVPNGAKLSFSRKRWFETPAVPVEPDPARGRSALAYPRRAEDATEFPGADGGSVNLHRYPWGPAHEDFVSAIEEPASSLGWTAVVRPEEGDLFLSLKNPHALPMTMLWHSNGGRDYAPWNGRHRGCLGVEEGAALPNLGLSSREDPDPLAAAGQPGLVTLQPAGTVDLRHILGAIRWPSGQAVAGVMLEGDTLTVTGDWGAERRLPILGGWLDLSGPAPRPAPRRPDWDL